MRETTFTNQPLPKRVEQLKSAEISPVGSTRWVPGRRSGYPPRPPQTRTCAISASGSSVAIDLRELSQYSPLGHD